MGSSLLAALSYYTSTSFKLPTECHVPLGARLRFFEWFLHGIPLSLPFIRVMSLLEIWTIRLG
jgi:hypothetical protein